MEIRSTTKLRTKHHSKSLLPDIVWLIKRCFLMRKVMSTISIDFKYVMATGVRRKIKFMGDLLILNPAVWTPMILNALVAWIRNRWRPCSILTTKCSWSEALFLVVHAICDNVARIYHIQPRRQQPIEKGVPLKRLQLEN